MPLGQRSVVMLDVAGVCPGFLGGTAVRLTLVFFMRFDGFAENRGLDRGFEEQGSSPVTR
jgi:TRAP-type C4-dicarboxylate transport system permease large subunit